MRALSRGLQEDRFADHPPFQTALFYRRGTIRCHAGRYDAGRFDAGQHGRDGPRYSGAKQAAGWRQRSGRQRGYVVHLQQQIDRDRSRLTITSPDQKQTVMQLDPDGPPNVIDTSAELNKPGAYVVRWQVLAVDGHITRGDVPFTVTGP